MKADVAEEIFQHRPCLVDNTLKIGHSLQTCTVAFGSPIDILHSFACRVSVPR
jgi:hypothetical protein